MTEENVQPYDSAPQGQRTTIPNPSEGQARDTEQTRHVYTDASSSGAKLDGKFEEEVPLDYNRISSDEALSALRRGETLQRCYVRQLTLSGSFDTPLQLREVYIRHLHIQNIDLMKNLVLSGCNVRRFIVENSHFKDSVSVKNSKFYFVHLKDSQFDRGLNATSAHFNSKTVIHKCIFEGRFRMWEAMVKDWFSFIECTFTSKVDLRSAIFEAGFTAPGCVFEDEFLFRGAHVALKWEAPEARFESLVDFSKAKLNDFVYLEEVIQGERQEWAFWNTVSDRILIKPEQVEGRLRSEEQEDYSKAMREYAVLKRSFESENQYSYDDWAFYRFKVNERLARGQRSTTIGSKLMNIADWFLLDWGCGYGTHPLRAIRTALVMITFFAMVYTIGYQSLHSPDQLPFPDLAADALLNRIGVSLFVSLAAFTSGFGDLREVAIGWMNAPIMLEALLGTLIWGLFIVAFGRKVIR